VYHAKVADVNHDSLIAVNGHLKNRKHARTHQQTAHVKKPKVENATN